MNYVVYIYQYLIFFYALSVTIIYFLLAFFSFFQISKYKINYTRHEDDDIISNKQIVPGISVVAPAFNEEVIVIDNVKSLLNLDYPNFEVVIVNDGSKDRTLELLIENFNLYEAPYPYIEKIRCKPVKRIFKSASAEYSNLIVVDKINGGTKADAMNAGINIARHDYFINTDVDCLLAPDTLSKIILPVLDSNERVIAVGATMRMANGCDIEAGKIRRVRPPKGIIPAFQETEYLRSYLVAKMGWSRFNLIPNVSGGFGLFEKAAVVDAGGFDPLSHAEDMDMTIRIAANVRNSGQKYKIAQIPDSLCWTEGPPNLKVLSRQRTRWGRGLLQIFVVHRRLIFNRRYGRLGMVILPYALIFEFLAPIIELTGVAFLLFLLFTQQINYNTFWLMLFFAYMIGAAFSLVTISYDMAVKKQYKTFREYLKLVVLSAFEAILYHPLIVFFSLRGYWQFLTRKNFKWGAMTRQGFTKNTQLTPTTNTIAN